MKKKKLTPKNAKALLMADGMDFTQDFHALGSSEVGRLAEVAKLAGYRKSKNAPGSTVRMFYQYLSRVPPVVRAPGELTPAERRAFQARARNKKTPPAQLEREIQQALSSTRSHATMKYATTAEAKAHSDLHGAIDRLDRTVAPTLGRTRAEIVRRINSIVRAADGRNVYVTRGSAVQRITQARTKGVGMEVRVLASGKWIRVAPEQGDRIDVR